MDKATVSAPGNVPEGHPRWLPRSRVSGSIHLQRVCNVGLLIRLRQWQNLATQLKKYQFSNGKSEMWNMMQQKHRVEWCEACSNVVTCSDCVQEHCMFNHLFLHVCLHVQVSLHRLLRHISNLGINKNWCLFQTSTLRINPFYHHWWNGGTLRIPVMTEMQESQVSVKFIECF